MKTKLKKIKIKEVLDKFEYSDLEEKGLYGWGGKLVIQPEYQRNFIYCEKNGYREKLVIKTILKNHPIGLLYFAKVGKDKYEVLDGQQRLTSIGRFLIDKFSVIYSDNNLYSFSSLPKDLQENILNYELLVYICEGNDSELKEWFKTINIAGVPLNEQELRNAIYSGPFVTKAKEKFSNSKNQNLLKWRMYIKGNPRRQEILEKALDWVSNKDYNDYLEYERIDEYMSKHKNEEDISELSEYFDNVINWVDSLFTINFNEMKNVNWGRLYKLYSKNQYDKKYLNSRLKKLFKDVYIKNKEGIFEYLLDGERNPGLLDIRFFDDVTKKIVYDYQTEYAKKNNVSNCPYCVKYESSDKIWGYEEMEADHITAWSKGGKTSEENCQMLCKTHNRLKSNKI
jgi:uncharacterized protein with ParB-like and HNH nuclease domain